MIKLVTIFHIGINFCINVSILLYLLFVFGVSILWIMLFTATGVGANRAGLALMTFG